MSNDIATRLAEFLTRQEDALSVVEDELRPWASRPAPWDDETIEAMEHLQRKHEGLIMPLHDEFAVLRAEWERSDVDDSLRAGMRERAQRVAERAQRVRALQDELNIVARAQIEGLAKELAELQRGRRQTRNYAGRRELESNYIDRRA